MHPDHLSGKYFSMTSVTKVIRRLPTARLVAQEASTAGNAMCFSYTLLPSGGYSKPLLVACGKHVIKELPTGRRFSYTWETTMDFHLLRHSITQLERIVKSEQVETSGEIT